MMQGLDTPGIPPRAHTGQVRRNGDDDNRNNTEIEKTSSTSLSGSPARPPVSPITPVTPETPEIIGEDGREATRTSNDNEQTIKIDLSKTSTQSQSHEIDPMRCQTQPVLPQTVSKSAPPSATMPTSNSTPVLVPVPAPPTTYIPHPPSPVPISASSNPDAIALRSAISLLQMQRQRGQKDMQTLEEIKQAALKDPEQFVGELIAGRVKNGGPSGRTTSNILSTSLQEVHDGEQQQQQQHSDGKTQSSQNNKTNMSKTNSDEDDDEEGNDDDIKNNDNTRQQQRSKLIPSGSKFAPIPTPQNIFRCPPINWAKYHVVGESLDKIHAEQIARPPTSDVVGAIASAGEPVNSDGTAVQARNPPYVLSAPYSPFQDTEITAGEKGNRKGTMVHKGGIGNG